MNNPVILHVNFVEQGQSVAEMCRAAVSWGYDGVEFRRKRSQVEETPARRWCHPRSWQPVSPGTARA
jgi:sugar phosphate isomerase/epimerase